MRTPPRNPAGLFDIRRLPTLPQTLIELIDACNERDVDLRTVSNIVGRDATISARILQLANSAFLGSRTSFADSEQAVIYLGIDTVRNLAISVAVHEAFQSFSGPAGMSLARFWHHSLLTAVLAKALAVLVAYPRPAEAYLAGLLHDLGKLLLGQAFPQEYRDLVGDGTMDPVELESLEKARLGLSHSEAGSHLVNRWHLQIPIAVAIEQHHSDEIARQPADALTAILYLANSLSMSPPPDISHFADLTRRMRIDPQSLAACLETAEETVSAIAEGMGIVLERPPLSNSEDAPSEYGRTELADKVRTLSRLYGALDNLVRAEDQERTFRVIEESLHLLFNIDKCLIFLPEPDGRGFSAHGSKANLLSVPANGFRITTGGCRDLVNRCRASKSGVCTLVEPADKTKKSLQKRLFSLFDSTTLLAIDLPAGDWHGFLVVASEADETGHLCSCREDLAFLARHAATRLYLDVLSGQHAEDLAGERVHAVQQVARGIAHEINNPLAIIENYLSILGRRLAGQTEILEDFRIIGAEIARIGRISTQLNDLSNPPAPPAVQSVDLNILVSETLNLFQHSLFAQQGIASQLDADPRIPPIMSNPEVLRQILANLLKNAAEALASGGKVQIRTEYLQGSTATGTDSVRIAIQDNGPGVASGLTETLFSAGVTGKGKGHLGLGLTIVRKLVTELGGSITCSSRQDEGTCFTMSLVTKN